MFGLNKKSVRINTVIGQDAEIQGDLRFIGGLHIDGHVDGNVIGKESGISTLTVSEEGVIKGEVHVTNLILDGTVTGNVYVSERLELAPRARVRGDVHYNTIEMAMGAEVNGNLMHEDQISPPMLAFEADIEALHSVESDDQEQAAS